MQVITFPLRLFMDPGGADRLWTRERVEAQLLAGHRPKPGVAIVRVAGRYEAVDSQYADVVEPLNWIARFVPDRREALVLRTWLRCQAEAKSRLGSDASFSEQCRDRGWNRSTAEEVRRRAAKRIVAGLNNEQKPLDTRKTGVGISPSPARRPVLVGA